ncbi:hypothetical protein [Burkholderia sp.]|uniref:hypothetical protein n=1 Tax=Burkholderia sp. TaxID=36773 RepID=UPI0025BF8072|nr:hypothetical protein [Burkholderia sp.]MBS6360082.1 hypothetical protein [Burkholderia sp.]
MDCIESVIRGAAMPPQELCASYRACNALWAKPAPEHPSLAMPKLRHAGRHPGLRDGRCRNMLEQIALQSQPPVAHGGSPGAIAADVHWIIPPASST